MIDCQLITYINYCLTHYLMSNLIAKAKADVEAQAAAKKEEEAFAEAQAKKEEEARAAAEADLSAKMKAQPSDITSEDESVPADADSISLVSELSMTLSDDDEMMETPRDRKPKTKPTDQGDKEDSKRFKQAKRNVRQRTKTKDHKRALTETHE